MQTLWKTDCHSSLSDNFQEWKNLFQSIFFSEEEREMGLTDPLIFSYFLTEVRLELHNGQDFPLVENSALASAIPWWTREIALDDDGHLVLKEVHGESFRIHHLYILTPKGETIMSYLQSRRKKEEMMDLFEVSPQMMINQLIKKGILFFAKG